VPRNFDEILESDLDFILGGETFTMRFVRPEALAAWEDEGDAPEDEKAEAALHRLDGRIKMFIVEEQHEKYDALRARETNPVTMSQLRAVIRWMLEAQSERPTTTPSPSPRGRGATAPTSAAA
jgi:hypothetical protein